MDFESEECVSDSESDDANHSQYWRQRRRTGEESGSSALGVRRSPRLAARATPQTARMRTSQRTTRRPN